MKLEVRGFFGFSLKTGVLILSGLDVFLSLIIICKRLYHLMYPRYEYYCILKYSDVSCTTQPLSNLTILMFAAGVMAITAVIMVRKKKPFYTWNARHEPPKNLFKSIEDKESERQQTNKHNKRRDSLEASNACANNLANALLISAIRLSMDVSLSLCGRQRTCLFVSRLICITVMPWYKCEYKNKSL